MSRVALFYHSSEALGAIDAPQSTIDEVKRYCKHCPEAVVVVRRFKCVPPAVMTQILDKTVWPLMETVHRGHFMYYVEPLASSVSRGTQTD